MSRRQIVAIVLGVLIVLAAIGVAIAISGGDDDTAASTTSAAASPSTTAPLTTTTTSTAPVETPPTTSCPPRPGAGVEAVDGPMPSAGMLVDGLEVAPAGCTDTITFTFTSNSPDQAAGYHVEYQPGPFVEDGSGRPVQVDGSAFLVVRLEPAYGYDFESGSETYTGPTDFVPDGTRYVRHAVRTGDFEAVVTWVFGLSERQPFTVATSGAPDRALVVEVG